jgi:hypothetical protein
MLTVVLVMALSALAACGAIAFGFEILAGRAERRHKAQLKV